MTKIINLTPHEIKIVGEGNKIIQSFPPSGRVARVETKQRLVGSFPVPTWKTEFGKVVDLPEPEKDTIYIVSLLVLQAVPERAIRVDDCTVKGDLVAPNTTPSGVVRNEKGEIIGVRGFQTL